jgi:aspartate-semialdehyde dehydrogenase
MQHPNNPSAGHRVGIVNPLTLAGNEIKTILREHAFPFGHITLLDSTGKDAGALTDVGDEPAVVTPISAAELDDLDLVFFCGPPENNREWIERPGRSYVAVDLSQPSASESGTLAVAGINLETVGERDEVLVSPHPIAIPIALLLHQIERVAAVDLCTASVVQPASAFEQAGVEELAQQTISVLNIQAVPKEVFDRQLAFNLYPAHPAHEEFIVGQIRSLAAPRAKVALFVTQGTIFHGHTFSLFVKTVEPVPVEAIVESLQQNGALAMAESDEQVGTIDAAGRDQVLVAEVRADPSIRGGFWVWAVCDNLRRSSALNAVLIAEKVLFGSHAAN